MYLVFDIGGTNTRLGVSQDGIKIDKTAHLHTNPNSYTEAIAAFEKTAKELIGDEKVSGIAGGIPGPIDHDRGVIIAAPNLPDWHDKPFRDDLQDRFSAPGYLENDAAVICLGEARQGAGKDHQIVVYMTVSTGIGGCRVVNQKVDVNARGFEPGHQVMTDRGIKCACGSYNHLEAIAGGASLEKKHGKPPEEIKDPEVWQEVTRDLAAGLNNVIMLWSPDIVIIGGSIMKSVDIRELHTEVDRTTTIFRDIPEFVPPMLGEEGGLLGGLALIASHQN